MVSWDDPGHVIVNALTGLVFLAGLVWVLSPAGRRARRPGWKWTLAWLLLLGLSFYIDGFYIPLGPLWVLWLARQSRNVPGEVDVS